MFELFTRSNLALVFTEIRYPDVAVLLTLRVTFPKVKFPYTDRLPLRVITSLVFVQLSFESMSQFPVPV